LAILISIEKTELTFGLGISVRDHRLTQACDMRIIHHRNNGIWNLWSLASICTSI